MANTGNASNAAQEERRKAKAERRAKSLARHNTRQAQRAERDRRLKEAFAEFSVKRQAIWDWWNNLEGKL